MSFSSVRDGVTAALGRLLDALCDPQRRTRTVLAVLVAYCAVWTLYAVIAKASQDIHFDMGEMVAWSREAGLGTPKHPPLPAWIVGVWFSDLSAANLGLRSPRGRDGCGRARHRLGRVAGLSR